jgi:hypothetical protein
MSAPFFVAAGCCIVAAGLLIFRRAEAPADPHIVPADATAFGAD